MGEALGTLAQADRNEVAYPTACTLRSLAQTEQAMCFFLDPFLLPLLVHKVLSGSVSDLVKRELAEVVNSTVGLCAALLGTDTAEHLKLLLSRDMTSKIYDVVHRALQQTRRTLDLHFPASCLQP